MVTVLTGQILKAISPRFGKLVAEEASRKGYLRYLHSRIITNAEEITFYGGHNSEKVHLEAAYKGLTSVMNVIYRARLWYVMCEQFFMKYLWSATGMLVVSIPILFGKAGKS